MTKHTFNNEYDVVIWAFSYLLHRFEESHNLFAAQCVWWIASLVKLREILEYYHRHNIFPSEYHHQQTKKDLEGDKSIHPSYIEDRDISPLNLNLQTESIDISSKPATQSQTPTEDCESESDSVDV
jgi:hypothetical protein